METTIAVGSKRVLPDDAESPYYCGYCGHLFSASDGRNIYASNNSSALLSVDCPNPVYGECFIETGIYGDARRFVDVAEVKNESWFHATQKGETWFSLVTGQEDRPLVHLGTRIASLERMMMADGYEADGGWLLFEVAISSGTEFHDIIHHDSNSWFPAVAGGSHHQRYSDGKAFRYINNHEDAGSISLAIDPAQLTAVNFIPVSVDAVRSFA